MADTQEQQVQQGKVFASTSRGFGFIECDGRSLYFHARNVRDAVILRRGDRVQFTLGESPKYPGKLECLNVTLIERRKAEVRS